jgi:hypothetical protein
MPVRKFRSVAEMPGVQWRTPLDPDNLRLACSLSQLAHWLHPMKAWQAHKEWVRSQLRRPSTPPRTRL